MGMSAEELRGRLNGVSEAKVVDPEELAKARKLRESMDNLRDVVEDVSIAFGESLVPALADAADGLVSTLDTVKDLNDGVENLTGTDIVGWAGAIASPFGVAKKALDGLTTAVGSDISATDRAWRRLGLRQRQG
jgi:hypothetical protein